ncbi:transposase [Endozoicomonas gorgoniicola]|uniref:Transposase n=1 Tax=Endozoicomonas gorgoniicola TaxID=1234144 RepID=A0ABT3N0D3_9GAMM|nr:transposase [Endozoicomonas gorgoniicola]MCW7555082.1 transposase [Endozoicomonas gorgoniicola]
MCTTPSLRPMFAFPGWVIEQIDIDWEVKQAFVYLRRDGRIQHEKCSQCETPMGQMKTKDRCVQDLPLGVLQVNLLFTAFQGRCSHCNNIETVTIPGLTPKAQATDRLKRHVSHLCRYMPCDKVPEFITISGGTARRWDKEMLLRMLPAPKRDGIRALLIDEKSIGKGHQYLTVVLNADSGETLFLGENLTPKQESSLKELLSMNEDLNQAYILKDMLKQLWTYTYKACASKFLDRWIELAKETGIAELKRFAKGLDRAREGLLSYCHHRITARRLKLSMESSNALSTKLVATMILITSILKSGTRL